MKRAVSVFIIVLSFVSISVFAQTAPQTDSLKSDKLNQESKNLDGQIKMYSDKITDVVKNYKLKDAGRLGAMPYQTTLLKGDGFIKIEKHAYIRDYFTGEIVGVKMRTLKLFLSGDSVTKFESEVLEKNYSSSQRITITIIDPSPSTEDTSDITFNQVENGKVLVENKKMSEIKNTAAFPVANDLKREFYIPHLTFFYDTILTIAESYVKNSKDADNNMTEYLVDSMGF